MAGRPSTVKISISLTVAEYINSGARSVQAVSTSFKYIRLEKVTGGSYATTETGLCNITTWMAAGGSGDAGYP